MTHMFSHNAGKNRHINHDNTYNCYLISMTSGPLLDSLIVRMLEKDCGVQSLP